MAEAQNGFFRQKKRDFTMVTNQLARDKNISLKAKGLYLLIQSYMDIPNFVLYKNFLRKCCKEGRDAFDGAWGELKKSGYLIQHRLRDKATNKYYYEYELLDTPVPPNAQENNCEEKPCTGNPYAEPCTGKPCTGKPYTENPCTGKPCTENPYGLIIPYQNNTYHNHTYSTNQSINHTSPTAPATSTSVCSADRLIDGVKERIGYDELPIMYPSTDMETVDELVMIMAEVLAIPDTSSIRINGCSVPVASIKNRYEAITMEHIVYAVDSLTKANGVRNPRAYAIAVLYNAPSTLNVNYQVGMSSMYGD